MDKAAIDRIIRESIPHCGELGLRLTEIGKATMTMALDYQPRLVGNPATGVLHGGVITTLVDTVSGMCVYTALGKLIAIATLDLRIDYLKPATPGEVLYARADCYKTTRTIAFTRCLAYHDPADPIASCVATFMLGSGDKPALATVGRPEAEVEP